MRVQKNKITVIEGNSLGRKLVLLIEFICHYQIQFNPFVNS